MTQYRPIKAEVNLAALRNNLQVVRRLAPNAKVMAVIKSNGYGHGIKRVADQLSACDAYGVASIDEAIALRQHGFLHRIILLEGLFSEAELPVALTHRLDFVVHSFHQLDWLKTLGKNVSLNLWLKFDTGMHRLGFDLADQTKIQAGLSQLKCHVQLQMMSHFSSADTDETYTLEQLNKIQSLSSVFKCPISMANSAAVQCFPQTHLDWVRPGIMLYGARATESALTGLKPAMALKSKVTALKWIDAGETVGYGRTWTAQDKTLLAVIAAGYGDGYPRHAPSGTPVWIRDRKLPLVGRVSMDMITVDVTEIADEIELGDEAVLWGEQVSVDEIADLCGTIGYELLCGVTQRVPRVEVSDE
ncbi:MAG: alanine racemase [Hydrogenovibrio sp.]|nr:alanine racemase [Hydrogenovibrio sp.]